MMNLNPKSETAKEILKNNKELFIPHPSSLIPQRVADKGFEPLTF
jgi:hypothetical protein